MKLKNRLVFTFLLLVVTYFTFAQFGPLEYFRAESQDDSIIITWSSSDENNIDSYQIERASEDMQFRKIATMTAKGKASKYSYIDDEVFMKGGINIENLGQYSYRLKLVKVDDALNTYSEVVTVSHKPSSIRRTWGMIKEMFR